MHRTLDRERGHTSLNTFQSRYGMERLPGPAGQNMMPDAHGRGTLLGTHMLKVCSSIAPERPSLRFITWASTPPHPTGLPEARAGFTRRRAPTRALPR